MEAPTIEGVKYKAWGQYSFENDQTSFLVKRGF